MQVSFEERGRRGEASTSVFDTTAITKIGGSDGQSSGTTSLRCLFLHAATTQKVGCVNQTSTLRTGKLQEI